MIGPVRRTLHRTRWLAVAWTAFYVGCAVPPIRHTPIAKLDSTLALDARRADALGLTPTAVLAAGLLRKGDLARGLGEGAPEVSPGEEFEPLPGTDDAWFKDARERHAGAIADALTESTDWEATYIEPLEDVRLRAFSVDDPVRLYNERGREFHEGFNLYLSHRLTARVANRVVLTAEPEFSFVENRGATEDDQDVTLRFQELSLSTRLGAVEVTVGRQPLWWGPGKHGALLMSTNAQALDMLRLSTPGPVLLPGFLGYLGLLRGEVFVSRLEEERTVERAHFAGARLVSRVRPWLEIGASRTALFGGRGRSAVTGRTAALVFTGEEENDTDDLRDQLASVDVRLIVPWSLQPFEVYAEAAGEDEGGGVFSHAAQLAGVYLPRLGPWHAIELTFEYAETAKPGRELYTDRNFADGYTYKEHVLGHHVGAGGLDLFGEVRLHPWTDDTTVSLSYSYEEHFRLEDVEERLHQIRVGFEVRAWKSLWLSALYQHDLWNNYGQQRGRSRSGHALGVGARWRF